MSKESIKKIYITENELEKVSGGEIGDGKYGGDGGYDDYFEFNCPRCGSNHFFVVDLVPEKIYRDGTKRPSNGLFRCMNCGKEIMMDL